MVPWAFGVPLVLVSALGLFLNGYVLLVVLGLGKQTQQQQTANTLLLIHLGAVEAAVCLILLIFTTGSWPIAGTWCVLHGFLLALLHPVALWTVTGLNCDRYYAIAAPLHYAALVSPRRVAVGLAASWTGALLLCVLPFWGLVPPYRFVHQTKQIIRSISFHPSSFPISFPILIRFCQERRHVSFFTVRKETRCVMNVRRNPDKP